MKKTSKILAASSIFASLAVIGGSLALLGYSGALFSLLPVLSSIGISTIGPILIAAAALFATLSLILSISFLRYRHLEKKNLKEQSGDKVEEQAISKKDLDKEKGHITGEQLREEKARVRAFSKKEKEDYFEEAIRDGKKLEISVIFSENGKLFKEVMPKYSDFIYYAAKEGGNRAVGYIKSLGVSLDKPFSDNKCSDRKYPPILRAIVDRKDVGVLRCLVENGANPNMLLLGAAPRLVNKGVNPNMELLGGTPPLTMAVGHFHKAQVEYLLTIDKVRDNIDAKNAVGDTALIKAFKEKGKGYTKLAQYNIVDLLLKNGADPTIENKCKQTALKLAKNSVCDQRVIPLLETAEKKLKEYNKKENYRSRLSKDNGSKVSCK